MKLVNLTPHPITLAATAELVRTDRATTIAPSKNPARVSTTPGQQIGGANGVPIFSAPQRGAVDGLPAQATDTIYIVSGFVAEALRGQGRADVVSPGTGPADGPVRNDKGHIVAVTRLIQAPQ